VIFGSAQLGALGAASPIRTIQTDLKKIGALTKITGVLDPPTVTSINNIFGGWDDVPARLRTGRLTKHDIARQLPTVQRYVRAAVKGALVFPDVNG
jgi:hypothetical protein